MPAQNTLANLFSNLQNAELRNKHECLVIPSSKLIIDTLNTMKENNYVGEFEVIDDKLGGKVRICLLYTSPSPRD